MSTLFEILRSIQAIDKKMKLLAYCHSQVLPYKAVMLLYDVPKSTLSGWINEKGLKHYRVGRRVYFLRTEIDDFITNF